LVLGHDLFTSDGGRWFHPYLILDLYSRKIVGWEVHANDSCDYAVHLVRRTALSEGIAAFAVKPVLHGDNGSTLKATTVLAMLEWLGVKPSYSRPRVSDDNAYAQSLFRTAKYRPEFPVNGFATLEAARQWGTAFVHWYNVEHKHSAMPGKTMPFLPPVMRCTPLRKKVIRHVGQVTRATGSPSGPLPSIRNVTPSSRSARRLTLFSSWLRKLGDNYLDVRRPCAT
jgi:transposase InsO family protein